MPVTHFDIDDQWNPDNIAEAKRLHEQDKQWFKGKKGVWEAMNIMPCVYDESDDDEVYEVNR